MRETNLDDDPREVIPMRVVEEVGQGDTVTTYYNIIHKDGEYWWEHDNIMYGKWSSIADAIDSAVESLTELEGGQ